MQLALNKKQGKLSESWPISRILYLCSDLTDAANPEGRRAESPPPYLALLPVGLAEPTPLPGPLVRSYRTVSPLPRQAGAVYFLLRYPSGRPAPDCPGHCAL